jgi:hypothetical protein
MNVILGTEETLNKSHFSLHKPALFITGGRFYMNPFSCVLLLAPAVRGNGQKRERIQELGYENLQRA